MSTINLYKSYSQKLNKFGLNDGTRFQDSFVSAVNFVSAELNDQVFQNQTLAYIDSFDDIIDERLISFNTFTFGAGAGESTEAMENREFWAVEWDLEKTSATNGMTDTIDDATAGNVVMSITNGVFSIAGAAVSATATIPTLDTFTLRFESTAAGNALLVDGDAVALTYTLGDAETSQAITAITSRVISATTGYTLNKTRFLSASTLILNFLINEGTGVALTDEVESFSATLDTPIWTTVYIEPSSGLDSQYMAVLNMGLDYHLQDGGEWAIEPEVERERKWYGRGIKQARNIFQNNTTYSNPLGI